MANGDGLMSLATNPNLSLAEKFALGFLSGAEANQRERIKQEEEYVRKRVETIKDRVTKQRAKYTTLRKEKEDQIKAIRMVAPGATKEIIQGLVSQGEDAVNKFVDDARQDLKMFKDRDEGKLGKFLSYVGKDGRLKRGDSSLYVPHTGDVKADELAKSMFRKIQPKTPEDAEDDTLDFRQIVGSFFGAKTPTEDLMERAKEQYFSTAGYGGALSGDAMDARLAQQEYFASGGTAESLVRKAGTQVAFGPPSKRLDTADADLAIAGFLTGLEELGGEDILLKREDEYDKSPSPRTLENVITARRASKLISRINSAGVDLANLIQKGMTQGQEQFDKVKAGLTQPRQVRQRQPDGTVAVVQIEPMFTLKEFNELFDLFREKRASSRELAARGLRSDIR
jgi:hypothetical protein